MRLQGKHTSLFVDYTSQKGTIRHWSRLIGYSRPSPRWRKYALLSQFVKLDSDAVNTENILHHSAPALLSMHILYAVFTFMNSSYGS